MMETRLECIGVRSGPVSLAPVGSSHSTRSMGRAENGRVHMRPVKRKQLALSKCMILP